MILSGSGLTDRQGNASTTYTRNRIMWESGPGAAVLPPLLEVGM